MGEWGWSRILKAAVANALLEEINRAYTEHVGSLVGAGGAPVPIADRIAAVAAAKAVPWLFMVGEYVALTRVPPAFAAVMTLKQLASLIGGIYWESEGVVLVKLDALASFLTAREERIKELMGRA